MSLILLRPIFIVFQLYEFISKIILSITISALHTIYCNFYFNNCACKKKHYHEPTFMCTNNNSETVKTNKPHNQNYSKKRHTVRRGLKDVPGPFNLPFIGSSWLYSCFGPYTHKKYHESNDDKYARYGPVVQEKIMSTTIIHLFAKEDINKILNHK